MKGVAFRGLCASLVIGALLGWSSGAQAGFVDIGGGWSAQWDNSLDGLVDINPVTVISTPDGDAVVIQKSATFTQGPVNGVFPSIPIVFAQTAANAAEFIVIDDEIIRNLTGVDWTDFHMDLVDGGNAVYDPARTAASGGAGPIGFTVLPFQQAAFSGDLERLDIWDGVVPHGAFWFPGDGITDGQLWIDVAPGSDPIEFTTFVLKETPTPEPGSLALLALGSGLLLRRR
jgi:hypothetical protein